MLRLSADMRGCTALTDINDEARETASRIERDNPRWIVIFGAYSGQFFCLPRFCVPPRTFVVARYPGAIPPRMRQIEEFFLLARKTKDNMADSRHARYRCDVDEDSRAARGDL